MIKLFLIFIFYVSSYANVSDDFHLYNANNYLNKNNLKKAIEEYFAVENKTDTIYYNIANIYYKQKKYSDAIKYYNKIKDKKFKYKKYHNLGNCFAQRNEIKKAILFYTKALKEKQDKDTQFNLELLKKNNNKKNNKDGKNKNNKSKKDNESKRNKKQQKNDNQNKKENKNMNKSQDKNITSLEEKRWNKLLKNRNLNTIMIPLNQKGNKDETNINPW